MEKLNGKIFELAKMVESETRAGKSKLEIFANFAREYGMRKESVRNLYYTHIAKIKNDVELQKNIGIDLHRHRVEKIEHFEPRILEKEMTQILENLEKKNSLRMSCLIAANYDKKYMLRLQNKYRNLQKTDPLYLQKIAQNMNKTEENFEAFTHPEKLLKMPSPPEYSLDDKDINNLFLGLVRMVKRNALKDVSARLKSECEFANETLRLSLVDLSAKTREIENVRRQNEGLKKELEAHEKLLLKMRSDYVALRAKNENGSQLKSLESFIENLGDKKLKKKKGKNVDSRII